MAEADQKFSEKANENVPWYNITWDKVDAKMINQNNSEPVVISVYKWIPAWDRGCQTPCSGAESWC
jgi:hypothetical protein